MDNLTQEDFLNLPEVALKKHLRKHLYSALIDNGMSSNTACQHDWDAVGKLQIPQSELDTLASFNAEQKEELLNGFTEHLANVICLHEQNGLPINWGTVMDLMINTCYT